MRNEEIHVLIERKITGSKDSDEHADPGQLSPQASGISSVTCTGLCSLQEVKNTCLKVSTTWATLCVIQASFSTSQLLTFCLLEKAEEFFQSHG